MLKTISAALIAASVIAAPALAAETGKTAGQMPVTKAAQTQAKAPNTAVKPDIKSNAKVHAKKQVKNHAKKQGKPKALNANASMNHKERHKSARSYHHRKMASAKSKSS